MTLGYPNDYFEKPQSDAPIPNFLDLMRKDSASNTADPGPPTWEKASLQTLLRTRPMSEKRQLRYFDGSLDHPARQGGHHMEKHEHGGFPGIPTHNHRRSRKIFQWSQPPEASVPGRRLCLELTAATVAAISTVVIHLMDRWLTSHDAESQTQWQAFDSVSPPASL